MDRDDWKYFEQQCQDFSKALRDFGTGCIQLGCALLMLLFLLPVIWLFGVFLYAALGL